MSGPGPTRRALLGIGAALGALVGLRPARAALQASIAPLVEPEVPAAAVPHPAPPISAYGGSAPARADCVVLPMSSGINILPGQRTWITARPQRFAFRPDRLIIGGMPDHWMIHEIRIGGRPQLRESNAPGEAISVVDHPAAGRFLPASFDVCRVGLEFLVEVTYVGDRSEGEAFYCGVLGSAAF